MSDLKAPRVYLSHRISQLRRSHGILAASDPDAAWDPPAYEVNALHASLASQGQLLINPTAIDELRFDHDPETDRRSPILTPRWPLPEQTMIWRSTKGSSEHTQILHTDASDEITSHVARSLSLRISSDVWFRDHAIVEHTPNLCVYRPFFCEAATSEPDWSGGVGSEMTHWLRYFKGRGDPTN